ncbi:MAG TPA: DUF885 domain-containing protein [Thermoanaerobaculia bacterium]|jgi:uncharacterized protein (DUF885 family)|nr:DUF885 domain-containing protein [Thermoanaerobaculia bacterium]
MPRRPFLALYLLAALLAPLTARAADSNPEAKLHDLFDREWEWRLKEDPEFATSVGRHEYDDRLTRVSPEDLARRAEGTKGFLAELKGIDPAQLSPDDQTSAEVFRRQLEMRLADFELGDEEMPFNADSGFHTGFAQLPVSVPFGTVRDVDNYLSRLEAWPALVAQRIVLMRRGLARGFTVPKATLAGYEKTISAHVVEDPTKSVFWAPLDALPASFPAPERERLRTRGRAAVLQAIAGYRTFLDFYNQEYYPKARTTLGASELPEGAAYYRQQIRKFTTLDLSPDEIHRIGLAEVERIGKEMQEVMKSTAFAGDLPAFIQFLRTDPRFYAKTPEELLMRAAWIAKRMDGKLPSLFGRLPRLPYTVEPVPDHLAPKYTSGRYVEAPYGSTRPGIYWVNTFMLESRPLYNLPALTLHESAPGHHLQGALAQEMENLPNFRRHSYISAYGEGWGLYSEWLGLEAGFYTDPYANFGRLTYEMWRACRLVVDTGLHAMGWTRQQSIDYLASHTALPLHECETETDRYISWPGQALSYKLGELKIKELRHRAEAALGEKFDVRAFHDVVLGSGSVPLGVLERNVDRWIAGQN